MVRLRHILSLAIFPSCLLASWTRDVVAAPPAQADQSVYAASPDNGPTGEGPVEEFPQTETRNAMQLTGLLESLNTGDSQCDPWISPKPESVQFPGAYQIPNTEYWWKFGGYIKGDLIHDFQPAGATDSFVPLTIPTDGSDGQNTLLQAKATRLNLDVRAPSDWGTARGFVETDFFTSDSRLRIRHAYAEVGSLLVGQTWSGFTDPDSIPRTLDFESPIAFITTRQGQFRWTQSVGDNVKWAVSIENPNTTVDDIITATIPGDPAQPLPDFVTRVKYKGETVELFAAGLFRELSYRPDNGPTQDRLGWATNLVGVLKPTDADKITGQFIFGSGLGRYRGGSDLGLRTPTSVEAITDFGGCFSLTHAWNKKLSSTAAYSFAVRRGVDADPPDTARLATYTAVNLIWEPIAKTTIGIEYLFGTKEVKDDAYGSANRLQISVQYNFP